jgi:hypothetical protein
MLCANDGWAGTGGDGSGCRSVDSLGGMNSGSLIECLLSISIADNFVSANTLA